MTESLSALVTGRWATLLAEGFQVAEEDPRRVVLHSGAVRLVVTASPRGEVEVTVSPLGAEWPRQWSWSGMVGRTEVGRLLDLALDRLTAEPQVLSGEESFYELVADKNEAKSRELNIHAQGGPPPALDPKRLP